MNNHLNKNINQPDATIEKVNEFKNFTRGGQITLHNIRMYLQIIDKVLWISGSVFMGTLSIAFLLLTTHYQRYVLIEYLKAMYIALCDHHVSGLFILPNGVKVMVKYSDMLHAPLIKRIIGDVYHILMISIIASFTASSVGFLSMSYWLKRRGKKHTDNVKIKGDSIIPANKLTQLLVSTHHNSDITLAGLPLIKNKETAHFFFHGTTGTGKSNAIKELLDQIRARGDRAVIYDKSCNYLEEYYQPGHDILLNPLDKRGEPWDLWRECRDSADFDNLAAAQIPMPPSNQDPFWVNAARTIFSATAFEMRNDPNRSISKLLRYLLTADLAVIQKYLKGTEAETLTSDKIEKTAVSIKSVLATYLKSLKYVKDTGTAFSIREWVRNESDEEKSSNNNWLFITSLGDRHETLKPLISSWLDLVANSLLSLPPSQSRRIWLILDELTSLQPLPYLTQTLSESRKFGGCVVIGVQNHAQLSKSYNQDGAREISSLLNTRFMFRQPDPDMAKWAATNFGDSIIDEARESISYGANTMRDGISINRVETQKQLINYSEIMSLADLHAYVRLPGQFPLTKVQFQYTERKSINKPFCLRKIDENLMRAVDMNESATNVYSSSRPKKDVDDEVDEEINFYKLPKKNKKTRELFNATPIKPTKLTEHALDI